MVPDIIEQVALVTGRIIHAGTGEAIVGSVRITAREMPVVDKVLADGTFVVSGRVERLYSKLSLTIHADSAQFIAGSAERQLPSETIASTETFDQPISVGTIALPADRVNIHGRVVRAADPDVPIVGALVEVIKAGVTIASDTTIAGGRYRIDNVLVLAPAEIQCSEAAFETQKRILLIDFGKLVNEEHFRLAPPL